jgi:hypothetical protein
MTDEFGFRFNIFGHGKPETLEIISVLTTFILIYANKGSELLRLTKTA